MTTNRQNQHPAAIDAEKPTNLKTKTKRAAALLLMLALLAPLAAWAQTYPKFYEFDSDSNGSINKNEMCIFFQDPNFCNILFDMVDADKNGGLSLEEVKSFSSKEMDCNNLGITSLAGIELFEELPTIKCSNNSLTEIDLSYNIFVSQLECYGNQILGDKMDALISSLPQATDGIFIVIDLQNPNEQNICTTIQVAAALTRGWVVYAINGEETVPYEGEEVFSGGSGTETDPYIIATTDDMDALAALVNSGNNQSGVYFLQTDTLNYTGKTYTPVGNNTNYFQGNYNGNGNIITGVDINTEYAGLFGRVGENGVVSNLTLDGIVSYCYIYGNYAGGIAAVNQGEIVGCSVLSSIIGLEKDYGIWIFEKYVHIVGDRIGGGVVGDNRGNVYDAVCTALIECGYNNGNNTTGGLVGTNDGQVNGIFGGVIYNSGIMSVGVVGGLVGKQYNGSLSGINRGYFNGNDSHWNLIRNGNQFRAEWTGCIVGSQVAGTVENCIYVGNRWNKFVESNHAGAIISSYEDGVLRNNYYVGECEINGMYNSINGSVDVTGQAMRGYKIESQDPLVINLEGNIGLTYEGNVYAGNEQGVVVSFEIQNSSLTPQCYAFSAGTLEDNGDGTYTITMPAEDITVSGNIVEQFGMFYEIPCNGDTTATLIHDDSYATIDAASVEDFEYQGTQYTVTEIAANAFDGCEHLKWFDCHANLLSIGDHAFRNCDSLEYLGLYQTHTPPTLGEGVFEGLRIDTLSIMVPFCSRYEYAIHPVWGQFGEIFPDGNCEYNFIGMEDTLWSNLANWHNANFEPCTALPGEGAQVGIMSDCEMDAEVTVGSITIGNYYDEEYGYYERLTVKDGATLTATSFIYNSGDARNLIIEDGAQVIHPNTGAQATVEKNITAYTPNSKNGWHLVSSPAIESFAPTADNGFLANEYDLYYYHEPTHYWRNHKDDTNNADPGFGIEPLKGYLYANNANDTLQLQGILRTAMETVNFPLSYTDGIALAGFNLVGNPFAHNVTSFTGSNVATEVYRMNEAKDEVAVGTLSENNPLKPGEGLFVKATGDEASITFNSRANNAERSMSLSKGRITLEVSENGLLVDRFILKRDGEPLEKFGVMDKN